MLWWSVCSIPVIFDQAYDYHYGYIALYVSSHLAEELIWRDITKLLLHLQVYDIIVFDDIMQL